MLGCCTPECLVSQHISQSLAQWTVSRHEKKYLIHVKIKINYTVVFAALKRDLG
jgi:hypothetical protein